MRVLIVLIFIFSFCHYTHSVLPANNPKSVHSTTVLILGGGMAGIAAAHTLQAAGKKDFLVLEATGRIGGRVRETSFQGLTIEEGANWIHGIDKKPNPLIVLARAANLRLHYTTNYDTITARSSNGQNRTNEYSDAYRNVEKSEKRMYRYYEDEELNIDISIKNAMKSRGQWEARTPEDFTAEYFKFDFVESNPPYKTSLLGHMSNREEEEYGAQEALVVDPEGFVKIIRHLAKQTFTANDPRLVLNETVTEVHYELENDMDVPSEFRKEGVYVRTASGKEYYARFGIITFPHPVLLSNNFKFHPNLPDWKRSALNQVEMAVYNKLFVKFADSVTPFWDNTQWMLHVNSENPASHTSSANTPLKSFAMQSALQRGDSYARGYFTVFLNLTVQGAFPGSNALLTILVDDLARQAESKTEAQLKTEIGSVLRGMYGASVPDPVAVFCTKWFTDPLALGSFHSIRAGITKSDIKNLKRGIRNLHFAGDGADAAFVGLLQNAYLTGKEKAEAILKEPSRNQGFGLAHNALSNRLLQILTIAEYFFILFYFLF